MAQQLSFARDIRPLFRDRDIQSMQYAFDLASYDDVRAHAQPIYAVLAAGQMPWDGAWPDEAVPLRLQLLRKRLRLRGGGG